MSIAVILAAYVTNYTQQATSSIPSACIGGALFFATASPTVDTGTCEITAHVESQYVALEDLQIEVDRSGVRTSPTTTGTTNLPANDDGYIYATTTSPCDDISFIRVSTSNCFNVKTEWKAPQ